MHFDAMEMLGFENLKNKIKVGYESILERRQRTGCNVKRHCEDRFYYGILTQLYNA